MVQKVSTFDATTHPISSVRCNAKSEDSFLLLLAKEKKGSIGCLWRLSISTIHDWRETKCFTQGINFIGDYLSIVFVNWQ